MERKDSISQAALNNKSLEGQIQRDSPIPQELGIDLVQKPDIGYPLNQGEKSYTSSEQIKNGPWSNKITEPGRVSFHTICERAFPEVKTIFTRVPPSSYANYAKPEETRLVVDKLAPTKYGHVLPTLSLAKLWMYPTVHQSTIAYPILHIANPSTLQKARSKNSNLRKNLEKNPTRQRLSDSQSKSKTNALPKTNEMNNASVNKLKSLNPVRQLHTPTITAMSASDPNAALNHFRVTRGYRLSTSTIRGSVRSEHPELSQMNSVLHSIRSQHEGTAHPKDTKFSKTRKKWGKSCITCCTSYRCTCISFSLLITIVVAGSIAAILYPIIAGFRLRHQ